MIQRLLPKALVVILSLSDEKLKFSHGNQTQKPITSSEE